MAGAIPDPNNPMAVRDPGLQFLQQHNQRQHEMDLATLQALSRRQSGGNPFAGLKDFANVFGAEAAAQQFGLDQLELQRALQIEQQNLDAQAADTAMTQTRERWHPTDVMTPDVMQRDQITGSDGTPIGPTAERLKENLYPGQAQSPLPTQAPQLPAGPPDLTNGGEVIIQGQRFQFNPERGELVKVK